MLETVASTASKARLVRTVLMADPDLMVAMVPRANLDVPAILDLLDVLVKLAMMVCLVLMVALELLDLPDLKETTVVRVPLD
jgi:ABC-type ATPase involved in cell division